MFPVVAIHPCFSDRASGTRESCGETTNQEFIEPEELEPRPGRFKKEVPKKEVREESEAHESTENSTEVDERM